MSAVSALRPLALCAAALLSPIWVSAQVVETVREYTILIEEASNDCENAQTIGDLCGTDLNVVYLGEGVSGRKLFTTPLPLANASWNNGTTTTSSMTVTNLLSGINGAISAGHLISLDSNSAISGIQAHNAAAACRNLVHGGYEDWYLPASHEAYALFQGRAPRYTTLLR